MRSFGTRRCGLRRALASTALKARAREPSGQGAGVYHCRGEACEAAAAVEVAALCGDASAEDALQVGRLAHQLVAMLTGAHPARSFQSIRLKRSPRCWMRLAAAASSAPIPAARSTAAMVSCSQLFDSVKYFRGIPGPSLGSPSESVRKALMDARDAWSRSSTWLLSASRTAIVSSRATLLILRHRKAWRILSFMMFE